MTQRRSRKSTARDPFGAYREIQFSPTVNQDPLEDYVGPPTVKAGKCVNWPAFLEASDLSFLVMGSKIAAALEQASGPAASGLTAISLNIFDYKRRRAAAPTPEEIEVQFDKMRAAVQQLAALSQGSAGGGHIQDVPGWIRKEEGHEASIIPGGVVSRSSALHPLLQDHIEMSVEAEDSRLDQDTTRDAAISDLLLQHKEMISFFENLPKIAERLHKAKDFTRTVRKTLHKERPKGPPADDARDWLLIRLMWIWRDAMEQDLTIYIRRISDGIQLQFPEPQGCAAFVVHVLRKIEPMLPHEFGGLERKLITLRAKVPEIPLFFQASRGD